MFVVVVDDDDDDDDDDDESFITGKQSWVTVRTHQYDSWPSDCSAATQAVTVDCPTTSWCLFSLHSTALSRSWWQQYLLIHEYQIQHNLGLVHNNFHYITMTGCYDVKFWPKNGPSLTPAETANTAYNAVHAQCDIALTILSIHLSVCLSVIHWYIVSKRLHISSNFYHNLTGHD